MLYNIKYLPLQCVFHGIRFKVNKGWLSGDNQFFFVPIPTLIFIYFHNISSLYISEGFRLASRTFRSIFSRKSWYGCSVIAKIPRHSCVFLCVYMHFCEVLFWISVDCAYICDMRLGIIVFERITLLGLQSRSINA